MLRGSSDVGMMILFLSSALFWARWMMISPWPALPLPAVAHVVLSANHRALESQPCRSRSRAPPPATGFSSVFSRCSVAAVEMRLLTACVRYYGYGKSFLTSSTEQRAKHCPEQSQAGQLKSLSALDRGVINDLVLSINR